MFITETWLTEYISDSVFFDNSYRVLRTDRSNQVANRGGGVLIAIKREIIQHQISYDSLFCEAVWCVISVSNCFKFIFGNVYIKPGISVRELDIILSSFEELLINYNIGILITGDFNIPDLFLGQDISSKGYLSSKAKRMLQFCSLLQLKQYNHFSNSHGHTLDYILSNFLSISNVHSPLVPFVVDMFHVPIEFDIKTKYLKPKLLHDLKRDYKKGNYDEFCRQLSKFDWKQIYSYADVNSSLDYFMCVFNDFIDRYIPIKSTLHSRFPFWFSLQLRQIIRRKMYHHRRYKITNNILYYNNFVNYRRLANYLYRRELDIYIRNIECDFYFEPRKFWSFVKESGLGKKKREPSHDVSLSAQGFADFFAESCKNDKESKVILESFVSGKNLFQEISINGFDENDIIESISKLKLYSGLGVDNIPSFIYRGSAGFIAEPLCYILNCSIYTCCFPNILKYVKVVPVYKNGPRDCVGNFRPISVLHSIAKIFERCVYNKIIMGVGYNLSSVQHGFLPNRSIDTNLITIYDHIVHAIEDRQRLDVIYFDLSKAFDRVNHDILINKLIRLNFSAELIGWFKSFVKGRRAFVKYNNQISNLYNCELGVPQGSILAPLLFDIYVDDMIEGLKSSRVLCYADDCKIFKRIVTIDDQICLQNDVDSFVSWCNDNDMIINMGKCSVVSYCNKAEYMDVLYFIGVDRIEYYSNKKDLGVIFTNNGSFHEHIDYIINKAFKVVGMIIRYSKFFSCEIKYRLFRALVLPIIEYGSILWNPHTKRDIAKIQAVGNRFYRYMGLDGKGEVLFYTRRKIKDLKFLYKIINNRGKSLDLISDISFNLFGYSMRVSGLFYVKTCHSDTLKFSPMFRLLNTYNKEFCNNNWFDLNVECYNKVIIKQCKI